MAELMGFQKPIADRAERSLRDRRFHVLSTCTGSGKTYIAAEVAKRLGRPMLIVSPKAAITQTRRCMDDMGVGELLLDVINPAMLVASRRCPWYNTSDGWKIPEHTLVVFDEIHRGASGIRSKTTLAVAQLKAYGADLLALSATAACDPLHLRALGYWGGLFRFAEPDYYAWCRKHGCFRITIDGRKVWKFASNPEIAAGHMRSIRDVFGDMFQSLGPSEIPGFPEERLEFALIDLESRDRSELDAAMASMCDRRRRTGTTVLAEGMKERERIEFVLASAVAERAAAAVEDGLSPVCFWNFTSARERFESELRRLGVDGIASIYGGQSDAERQGFIDAFEANEIHAASVNVEAGGCALSLHDVLHARQRVSYIIPSYNAASVKQALGRIRRSGGTGVVQRFVIAVGTKMEDVYAKMKRKLNQIDSLNDEDLVPEVR